MPREYYTNMLALRSDILLMYRILSMKEPELLNHLKDLCIDLSLIVVESFLTIFTNTCHPTLVDVILEHFFTEGSTVLLKAMTLILGYLRKDLLEMDNFGNSMRPYLR